MHVALPDFTRERLHVIMPGRLCPRRRIEKMTRKNVKRRGKREGERNVAAATNTNEKRHEMLAFRFVFLFLFSLRLNDSTRATINIPVDGTNACIAEKGGRDFFINFFRNLRAL